MEPSEFDPFSPAAFDDPYPAYARMRREQPVLRREIESPRVWPHYWMLSRAADVERALQDWETFSSARGTLIDTDISLIPPNMFNMDPPRHDELRAILARVLTPARVASLEAHVRGQAGGLVRQLADGGKADAATDYAQHIPTLTMCELMDLPTADRERFLEWEHGDPRWLGFHQRCGALGPTPRWRSTGRAWSPSAGNAPAPT